MSGDVELLYADDAGRLRNSRGRFASYKPSEVCPNGCERFGDWWVPVDCATHLGEADA